MYDIQNDILKCYFFQRDGKGCKLKKISENYKILLPWKPSILEGKILNSSAYKFIQMTQEKTGRERIFHAINCFCNSICH